MNQRGIVQLILPIIVLVLVVGFIWYQYTKGNIEINIRDSSQEQESTSGGQESTANEDKKTSSEDKKTDDIPFCKNYGTFEVKKTDLFKEYLVGPGETLRDVAKKTLEDETKAVDFISVNPQLATYEIDDELPMNMKLYIPNEKYSEEGVTAYIKSRGNITYNNTKPMFGINAPNSGTGPFIISDDLKDTLKNVKEGDCVEVIYGSKGFDPQKFVFEVTIQ